MQRPKKAIYPAVIACVRRCVEVLASVPLHIICLQIDMTESCYTSAETLSSSFWYIAHAVPLHYKGWSMEVGDSLSRVVPVHALGTIKRVIVV